MSILLLMLRTTVLTSLRNQSGIWTFVKKQLLWKARHFLSSHFHLKWFISFCSTFIRTKFYLKKLIHIHQRKLTKLKINLFILFRNTLKSYSEIWQISTMEPFVIIFNSFMLVTIFARDIHLRYFDWVLNMAVIVGLIVNPWKS